MKTLQLVIVINAEYAIYFFIENYSRNNVNLRLGFIEAILNKLDNLIYLTFHWSLITLHPLLYLDFESLWILTILQ